MTDQDRFALAFLDFVRSNKSSADCAKFAQELKIHVNKKISHKYKSHADTVVYSSVASLFRLLRDQENVLLDDNISANLTEEFLKIVSKKISKLRNERSYNMPEGYDQNLPGDNDNDDDDAERLSIRSILSHLISDMKDVWKTVSADDTNLDKLVKLLTLKAQGLSNSEIAQHLGEKPDTIRKAISQFFKKPAPEIVKSFEQIQSQLFYGLTFEEFAREIDSEITSSIANGFKMLFNEQELMILSYTIDELDSEQILEKINEEYGGRMTEAELTETQKQIKKRLLNFFRKNQG